MTTITSASTSTSTVRRVTVTTDTRRADLVLPGAVPVSELVPGLARLLGILEPASPPSGGAWLLTLDGRVLRADAGLAAQGVGDGAVLALGLGDPPAAPRVYDDVVEAVADLVRRDGRSWGPAGRRRACGSAAVLALLAGTGCLLTLRPTPLVLAVSLVAALTVSLAGALVSRHGAEPALTVGVGVTGSVVAAVAGALVAARGQGGPATELAAAGAGAAVAGLLVVGAGSRRRVLTAPGPLVGSVVLLAGAAARISSLDLSVVMLGVLVLVVAVGGAYPAAALAGAVAASGALVGVSDSDREPAPVDLVAVADDLGLARDLLIALTVSVGLLLVLAAPFAVGLGPGGAVVAVLASAVELLRARRHRWAAQVVIGVFSGSCGLASTAVSVWWLLPGSHALVSLALVVTGVALLAVALPRRGPSLRGRRLVDATESLALLALAPAFVVGSGILSTVLGRGVR
ncbi:MAG: EsaB/YukD family protein [Nocardioides sp.]